MEEVGAGMGDIVVKGWAGRIAGSRVEGKSVLLPIELWATQWQTLSAPSHVRAV
jgi:hypothetical protein